MSLSCRTSIVGWIYVNSIGSSGTMQLGDGGKTDLKSKALAVQRAIPNNFDDEFRFASYPLFYKPALRLLPSQAVVMNSASSWPTINIGSIYALGVSDSALLRAGCGGPVRAESRIKHIRNFNVGAPTDSVPVEAGTGFDQTEEPGVIRPSLSAR
ncbi:spore germination protein GerPE [Paenibacillaceae bacterium WGS1546]|uniref:spore germination protein GerPE n=1 Tax=Cohnella sp. WGS1546 TaxID=3366810 RepID=UPI00372D6FA1